MKINPTHTPRPLIKTDIIEPLEARAADTLHPMIRHEEILLPAHEEVFAVEVVFEGEGGGVFFRVARQGAEGGEARPVLEVDLLAAVPGGVGGAEEVFRADDFAFEEGC